MTISELIEKLKELGDENFRNTATVRIMSSNGAFLSEPSLFDVKAGVTSVDIYTDLGDRGEVF